MFASNIFDRHDAGFCAKKSQKIDYPNIKKSPVKIV